jgi:hypothetical protein
MTWLPRVMTPVAAYGTWGARLVISAPAWSRWSNGTAGGCRCPATPQPAPSKATCPKDGITKDGGSWVMRGGPLFWSFSWDELSNKGLEGPTLQLSASNGQQLRLGGPDPKTNASPSPAFRGCQDRGQPSRLARWP